MKINRQHTSADEEQRRTKTAGPHPACGQKKRGEGQQRHSTVRTTNAAVKNQHGANGQQKRQQDSAARADEFPGQQRTHNHTQDPADQGRQTQHQFRPAHGRAQHPSVKIERNASRAGNGKMSQEPRGRLANDVI